MTFKEYLVSKGLTEEQATAVMDGMPDGKFYLSSEEKLDERYAKLKGQKEGLESQLSTIQGELNTLKETSKGNDELTKQLADVQEALDSSKAESEQKLSAQQKEFAIKLALKDSHTLDEDILLGLLDKEVINVTDDGLKGLKDQLERIQTEKPFLFPKAEPDGQGNPAPKIVPEGNPPGASGNEPDPFEAKLAKYN